MKAILFDCDGTIADSCALICTIMQSVFAEHGLPSPPDAMIRKIIGLSLETAIAELRPDAPADEIAAMAATYRVVFRARRSEPQFREALFPGMKALVERLSARDDVLVGMVTGKSRRGVAAICASHGIAECFAVVRTADDCASKPDPAMVTESCDALGLTPADALVVGDSIYDMQMARAAGASGLGVGWGTFGAAFLIDAGAFAVAETVEDLGMRIDAWLAQDASGASPVGRTIPSEAPVSDPPTN